MSSSRRGRQRSHKPAGRCKETGTRPTHAVHTERGTPLLAPDLLKVKTIPPRYICFTVKKHWANKATGKLRNAT